MKNYFRQETVKKIVDQYHLVKESVEGKVSEKHIKVAKTLVIASLGTIGVCLLLPKHKENYEWNPNYASYVQQVEHTKQVAFQPLVEEEINELQNVVMTAQSYQESEPTLTKIKMYENLANDYSMIEEGALNTLKYSVAKKHGGNFSDYRINYEDSDGCWVASHQEKGAITLTGNERDLAFAIGSFQDYSSQDLYHLSDSRMDDYVNSCLKVSEKSLSLAIENLGEKTK